jgi:hypothetical protein
VAAVTDHEREARRREITPFHTGMMGELRPAPASRRAQAAGALMLLTVTTSWLPTVSGAGGIELRLQKLASYDAALPFQEAYQECGLAANIPAAVTTAATGYFSNITIVDDATKVETGLAAAIRVAGLEAPGGGAWTGAKQLAIEVTLYRNGTRVDQFRKSHRSKGHSVGLFKAGNCSILNDNAKALSRQAAYWLKDQLWTLGLED